MRANARAQQLRLPEGAPAALVLGSAITLTYRSPGPVRARLTGSPPPSLASLAFAWDEVGAGSIEATDPRGSRFLLGSDWILTLFPALPRRHGSPQ